MSRKEDFKKAADDYVEGEPDGAQKIVGQVGFEFGAEHGYQYAQTYPNWISVEDELPKENGKTQQSVSVWATDGLTSGEFRYNFDTKTWTDMWGDPFDVTHWMPLPQPPRKEEINE